MMLYRDLKTGGTVRLLAHGTDTSAARMLRTVAIYCQADDEHTIRVRDLAEFEAAFIPLPAGDLSI